MDKLINGKRCEIKFKLCYINKEGIFTRSHIVLQSKDKAALILKLSAETLTLNARRLLAGRDQEEFSNTLLEACNQYLKQFSNASTFTMLKPLKNPSENRLTV